MNVQVLVAAVNAKPTELVEKMNIQSDALIVNQCDSFSYEKWEKDGHIYQCYSMKERGVGLSRNTALMRADGSICLFSDEDIIYENDYENKILSEFEKHPEADMLLFNIEVGKERETYKNTTYKRVHLFNCGRYGAVSFAVRTKKLHQKNITFSLLFGGGAKYANGEDSLFLSDCIKKSMKVYTSPCCIGREEESVSSWFMGYNETFFVHRGVLYHYLYKKLAAVFSLRFLIAHQEKMCKEIPLGQAYRYMKQGILEAKGLEK